MHIFSHSFWFITLSDFFASLKNSEYFKYGVIQTLTSSSRCNGYCRIATRVQSQDEIAFYIALIPLGKA